MSQLARGPNVPAVRPCFAVVLLVSALAACGNESGPNPVREAFAQAPKTIPPSAAVALRFPARGSDVRLYRLPMLEEVSWSFETIRPSTEQIVGFASDADLVFTLAAGDSVGFSLVALDMVTGRSRVVDSSVAAATLGPTDIAYVVHVDGTVGQVDRRSVVEWPDTLTGVTHLWGAARERLLAVAQSDSGRELVLLSRGQATVRQPIPEGTVVSSHWGRLVAVTTDSGVALLTPHDPEATDFVPLTPPPRLIAMSPSGHRIYVAVGDSDLVALGRFGEGIVRRAKLPGRASDLRVDPRGQTLLARMEASDSVWVVDGASLTTRGTVAGSWEVDLPSVTPDGIILLRHDGRLVAVDPESLELRATADERRGDKWLITAWDPRRPALEVAAGPPETGPEPGRLIYVQVSSSGNPAWAEDLAQELRAAGLDATVLQPDSTEERYRVVLGPFPTREAAEEDGRRLGRPFWILTRDTVPPLP